MIFKDEHKVLVWKEIYFSEHCNMDGSACQSYRTEEARFKGGYLIRDTMTDHITKPNIVTSSITFVPNVKG